MPAYILAIRKRVTDPEEMAKYGALAMKSPFPAGYRLLAMGGKFEALEGGPVDGVILAEFPSYEAAKAWYNSEEYQKAVAHRHKGSEFDFLVVEGLPPRE